ncbi:MAG TPA: MGMT family protein [Spirochaetota bacterium]|nr:MGMT family protein [Spirochaetota bacterium]
MKPSGIINQYFYAGKIFSLKITASPGAVITIDFISHGKQRSKEIPFNVQMLFNWLDDYSAKKTDSSHKIIFTGINETVNPASCSGKKMIVLDVSGCTENQLNVYRELIKVTPGETISYGALAERSGIARGGRFVGNVMAKNAFPVIIPCHRVIRGDGSMGNYSGGVDVKRMLLEHEAGGFSPARS